MIEYLPLPGIDLECVDGEIRTFYGCSLEGLFEFQDRRLELFQICADSERSLHELYATVGRVRFLINRCLMLNGIQPAWVSPRQIEELLFVRETPDGLRLGALVELNLPPQPAQQSNDPPPTLDQTLAALAAQCSSISEALDLARNEPAKKILAVMSAKAEQSAPPEVKLRKDLREFARKERAKNATPPPQEG